MLTRRAQELHDARVPPAVILGHAAGRAPQRDVGTKVEQQLDGVGVPQRGGRHERGKARVRRHVVGRGPMVEQKLRHAHLVALGAPQQRGPPGPVQVSVDVGVGVRAQEPLQHVDGRRTAGVVYFLLDRHVQVQVAEVVHGVQHQVVGAVHDVNQPDGVRRLELGNPVLVHLVHVGEAQRMVQAAVVRRRPSNKLVPRVRVHRGVCMGGPRGLAAAARRRRRRDDLDRGRRPVPAARRPVGGGGEAPHVARGREGGTDEEEPRGGGPHGGTDGGQGVRADRAAGSPRQHPALRRSTVRRSRPPSIPSCRSMKEAGGGGGKAGHPCVQRQTIHHQTSQVYHPYVLLYQRRPPPP